MEEGQKEDRISDNYFKELRQQCRWCAKKKVWGGGGEGRDGCCCCCCPSSSSHGWFEHFEKEFVHRDAGFTTDQSPEATQRAVNLSDARHAQEQQLQMLTRTCSLPGNEYKSISILSWLNPIWYSYLKTAEQSVRAVRTVSRKLLTWDRLSTRTSQLTRTRAFRR